MSNRKTPVAPVVASPAVTFDPALIQRYIDEALAKQKAMHDAELAAVKAEAAAKPAGKSKTDENIWKCKKAFAKAGYKNVEPNVNVLTFNKWFEQGRRVKEGESATKVANLRLFHFDQTRPATKAELAEHQAKMAERTADKLPVVSPIASAPVAAKGKSRKVVPINQQPTA